jgi:hypothetical protein
VGAAQGRDTALGLHLAEAASLGGHHDVARQRHLDADGEADALDRGHHGLAALVAHPERIDVVFGNLARFCAGPEELRHVQPRGEVVALGAKHADPEVRVAIQLGHGGGELGHHFRHEGVLLGRIVDGDLQDAAVTLAANPSLHHCHVGHVGFSLAATGRRHSG